MNLKVSEAIRLGEDFLKKRSIPKPLIDCEIIMGTLLRYDRAKLYSDFEKNLSSSEFENYMRFIERRGNREPTQHITGFQEFWSLDFMVNSYVLIPRPETEALIERVLALETEMRGKRK